MEKKTKILAIGDLHGDTGLVKKLAKKAKKEDIDLIILAGDITFAEKSTTNLIGPFIKEGKKVLVIPGNHESESTINFLSKMYENTTNIHGYSFQQGELGIFGAGSADIGIHMLKDSEIFSLLEKGHKTIEKADKKIMVTHMHHYRGKAEFSGWPGSKAITKAVKKFKPDFLVSAHIHEAGGLYEKLGKTKIINVSRNPTIFEI